MSNDAAYIRIDERTDVLASLSVCLKCLEAVEEEPLLWKWAILSLHNALQGAMVCHLSGTAQIGALKDTCAKKWLAWHEKDRRGEIEWEDCGVDELGMTTQRPARREDYPPQERLADAKTLFKRLYTAEKRCESAGEILNIGNFERDAFKKLHELRNDLTHFSPKGWLIEIAGLPEIFLNVLAVLSKIANDPWPFQHMKEEERTRLSDLMDRLGATLRSMI